MGVPKKRRTQVERRATAEKGLIDAAIELLATRGYHGFTLADVGETAGYSRGITAHYFGVKEELLALAASTVVEQYYDILNTAESTLCGIDAIEAGIRVYAENLGSPATHALAVLVGNAGTEEVVGAAIRNLNKLGRERLIGELKAGVAAGNIRPDINFEQIASLIYVYDRGLLQFSHIDPDFDASQSASAFIQMLRAAIATEAV